MTKTEWVQRCAKELRRLDAELPWPMALRGAGQLMDDQIDMNGITGLAWERPEDVAERWADDGVEGE